MNLRPYQERMIESARELMRRGSRDILMQLPTGGGKTIMTAHMLHRAAQRGLRSWFVVHRRELMDQAIDRFSEAGISCGVIRSGRHTDLLKRVQVCTVQTLCRRLDSLEPPDMVVFDECSHIASKTWDKVHRHCHNRSYRFGLTATPQRLDGRGLGDWFTDMIHGPTTAELINWGYLSSYKMYGPPVQMDVTGIKRRAGDYARGELSEAINTNTITGCALSQYKSLGSGGQFIGFAVDVAHSKSMSSMFVDSGIPCSHLDGKTPAKERDGIVSKFRNREIRGIFNCDLFSEGLDVPGIEVAILMRPTCSLSLYLQQVGRALRKSDRPAVILDHAGNCLRHGLPDDPREWTLEGREIRKRGKPSEVQMRICEKCLGAQKRGPSRCSYCGYEFKPEPRDLKEIDAELVEMNRVERKIERGKARSMEQLVLLGQSRGYKNPHGWAYYVYNSRKRKR